MTQVPNRVELDEFLNEIVRALHRTVSYAMPHLNHPTIANQAVHDCGEILAVVMEGKVSEWLS